MLTIETKPIQAIEEDKKDQNEVNGKSMLLE